MNDIPGKENLRFLHGEKFVKFWDDYFEKHRWEDDELVNIYIDFPYCVSTCKYCMIHPPTIHTRQKHVPIYEAKLLELIESMKHIFPKRPLGQIAFGGGTASLMSRETIREIIKTIEPWNTSLARKMEIHPRDITDDYLKFLVEEVNITNISIGIQSFNIEANRGQARVTCNINKLIDAVNFLHENKVSVNIDLVALFNGEEEEDWQIFRDDMKIVKELLSPDMFFTQVNYATEARYYEHSLRLRKEMKRFLEGAPEYDYAEKHYGDITIDAVQRYLDTTYFFSKPDYLNYLRKYKLYTTDPRFGNYIGFGGNVEHRAFSLTAEKDTIYSYYDFHRDRWVHWLTPTVVPKVGKEKDAIVPTINVGGYTIPPYDPELSGPIDELERRPLP